MSVYRATEQDKRIAAAFVRLAIVTNVELTRCRDSPSSTVMNILIFGSKYANISIQIAVLVAITICTGIAPHVVTIVVRPSIH